MQSFFALAKKADKTTPQALCCLTLQVGEVRIIAFRPARHTEVDYLVKVQVIVFCRLRSVCRSKSQNIEPKVEERIPTARIFANLRVGRSQLETSDVLNLARASSIILQYFSLKSGSVFAYSFIELNT